MESAINTISNQRYSPSMCLTHACNLSCRYCYQCHDKEHRMSYDIAQYCIEEIFRDMKQQNKNSVTINFIGGEPLLEFELMEKIFAYTEQNKKDFDVLYFASTNGTILNNEMKDWFTLHKDKVILGLSLDGTKNTHDFNRSNSFDKIDIPFFINNWPEQGVKMTLSEYSLKHLAENIIYIHNLGFKRIDGVNLFEGNFDWAQDKFIEILIPELFKLKEFYLQNPELNINQMLNKNLELCAVARKERKKKCGIGTNVTFFDTDGKKYPCSFVTPMTFSTGEISEILQTNFYDEENFVDDFCYDNCYLYPICSSCAGANFLANHSFKEQNKSKCKINKLIALFIADLQAHRIIKYPEKYTDETVLYYLIEAIHQIKALYLDEFKKYFQNYSEDFI